MYETKRLFIRNWTATDIDPLGAIVGDPEVMKFSDGGALGNQDQQNWLHDKISLQPSQGPIGNFAIEHRPTGQVIGYVSLSRDTKRIGQRDVEIGIRLARSAWGYGYGVEAVHCMTQNVTSPNRIVAIVDPNNHRSVKLLKKVGLIYECDIMFEGYDYPDHFYARPAELTQP